MAEVASDGGRKTQPRRTFGLRPWFALLLRALIFFLTVRLDTTLDTTG